MNKKFLYCILFFLVSSLNATSLVYNLRTRRAFNLPGNLVGTSKLPQHLWIASAVPIIYQRNRHIVIPELKTDIQTLHITAGSLFNLRYKPSKNWWFEMTTALEKERACSTGTLTLNASRGGFDDFVFSGGYQMFPKDHTQMVVYGLFGVPSRWHFSTQENLLGETLVGTRFFSVGGGFECSYGFIENLESSLIGVFQARVIHFFTRSVNSGVSCNNLIQPGNLVDILFLTQYRKEATLFEFGYNPTFFTNQAVITNDNKTKSESIVRQGFTASCTHFFKDMLFSRAPLILGTGINISSSKRFDTKTLSAWLNFTTIF